jgi:hypothetical protein
VSIEKDGDMGSGSTTAFRRATRVFCAVCLLALAVSSSGCGRGLFGFPEGDDTDALVGSANKSISEGAPDGTVMKSESVRLEGKWTWPSLKVDYTGGRLQNPRIYPIERVGEGWTFTIIKKGDGYTTVSGGTVTLKGTSVTITENSSDGDSITLTGEVKGDTIVGTVHQSISAKTLSSGVAQGAGEYDGPWTATRVE